MHSNLGGVGRDVAVPYRRHLLTNRTGAGIRGKAGDSSISTPCLTVVMAQYREVIHMENMTSRVCMAIKAEAMKMNE